MPFKDPSEENMPFHVSSKRVIEIGKEDIKKLSDVGLPSLLI